MTEGPIFSKLFVFSVPVILTGVLQLLYNAADMIVVGQFAEQGSLAAVGATGALIALITNVLMGIGVGASVIVGRNLGRRDEAGAARASAGALIISLVGGVLLGVLGFCFARPMLELMDTPADVIDRSVSYMKIFFLGLPANAFYNFGSACIRAVGDTKRPLLFLFFSGLFNVALNLVTVLGFNMGVSGVAIATVVSQIISAVLTLIYFIRVNSPIKLTVEALKVTLGDFALITKIGLPAGIQGSFFSISNVLIQSSVNSFGSIVMDGNTAASSIENFVYIVMNSIAQATLAFVSQNHGALKFDRIKKIVYESLLFVLGAGVLLGGFAFVFKTELLGFYTHDPDVISHGIDRMTIICTTYFLCGMMDVMSSALRGLGRSATAMIVSLVGSCLLRIVWIYTIFKEVGTIQSLYISYPISWLLTVLVHCVFFFFAFRKEEKLAAERVRGRLAESGC